MAATRKAMGSDATSGCHAKPSAATYSFADCNGECLIGQWMRHAGLAGDGMLEFCKQYNAFCDKWGAAHGSRLEYLAVKSPETFGGALSRARNLLSERNR